LGAIVIVCNDEFSHRYYACEFQRIWNIAQSLDQTTEFKDMPILYIRLNPHTYWRDEVCFSQPLEVVHDIFWETLQSIESVNDGVNLVYIHYDKTDGMLDIFQDTEDNQ
jgi:hypothetical protein